uniref:Uncharacterized protein n=1 Tax=Percolomonas cosmopolitus TaxID=63605 RepID=A0A7S1PJR4_9EUKA|eukprot:CAMPEP_0117445432 /NCGR_PEP_ID=MMETSP0759-20121206/5792_1 /TAXON_ID=63605 /ORGANISM="Percolomonas cosmopolitus, Strain WS" /LENGTH=148 /DNA_ID=CAMNT_0005237607 /DNA_START=44 /DNA_END=490 /DNA_ORIENTATION=+
MVKRSLARRLQIALQKKGRVYSRKANNIGNQMRVACVNFAGQDVVKTIEERENKQIIIHEQASLITKYYVGSLPFQFDQLCVELKEFNQEIRKPLDMKMGYMGMWLYTIIVMIAMWYVATMVGRGFRMYGYRYADIDPKLEWKAVEYK